MKYLLKLRPVTFLITPIILLAASVVSGNDLEDRKWIEVRTENFRIHSILSEKKTKELAHHLELFRIAVTSLTNVSSTKSTIPTKIYALRSQRDLEYFGFNPSIGGLFLPGMRENIIVLRDVRGMSEASIIMHEYVHFLVRNHGSLQYPKWYDEGFAEYLSAARVHGKYFEIGLVPEGRMKSLQYSIWIPIRQIISPEGYDKWSRERQAMFYAEAWALVHYLQNQPDRQISFIEDMLQYIDFIESGKGDIEAFEEAFGISAKNLNKEVKRYLTKGQFTYFKVNADQLLPAINPIVTKLTKEQASLALGQLALKRGKFDKAEHLFSIASADGLTQPRAVAGLGDTLKFQGDFKAALPYFKRAVALAPEDPYCQLDLAEYWHDLSTKTEEADKRSEYLNSAREHYMAAWKLDESAPETYAMYGKTFLDEGFRYDKAIEMLEEAQNLLPSSLSIRLMLAKAYLEVDRLEDAIEATLSVLAWSHSESGAAKQAQDLLTLLKSEPE